MRDFRNDVILAEACHGDVEKMCKSEPAGGTLLHHLPFACPVSLAIAKFMSLC